MNQGFKAFLIMTLLTVLGVFLLIVSVQSRQFRQACEQTCSAKDLRAEWRFVMAPLVVPECSCRLRRSSKAAG